MSFGFFKKLRGRSTAELKLRGRQFFSQFAERAGLAKILPASDAELWRLFDESAFNGSQANAELLLKNFQSSKSARFFAPFAAPENSARAFREQFGINAVRRIVERAERNATGKFDLLGFSALDFGMPADWRFEPTSGKRSSLKHWKKFDELGAAETGDLKIVWELNRHQHFFTLGAAYWLTGDERFAAAFVTHLSGWQEQNPPPNSINWVSSLEVALRAVSWIWALHFFKFSSNLSPQIFADVLKFLYAHGRHIEKYLSTFYSPNTHLTGEALGLYYLGALFPQFKAARRWRELGAGVLLAELERQLLPDGVYFEQSTWYHRYTIDFYTQFLILSRLNGEEFSDAERATLETKLQSALDFLLHTTRPDGTTPLVGDDDGGRSLPFGGAAVNDFRCALAAGAILFGRGDYKFAAQDFCEETFWLMGANAKGDFARIEAHAPPETSKHFPHGGWLVMRDGWTREDANFLLIDGGQHGALSGGHAHADALCFELSVGGRTTLADAGTFAYHSAERDYFRSTTAHNTLTVDGKSSSAPAGKFSWATQTDTHTSEAMSHRLFDYFVGSHDGFSDAQEKIRHTRRVFFVRRNYWIVQDTLEAAGTHKSELHFHFAPDSSIKNGGEFVFNAPSAAGKTDGLKILTFGGLSGAWRVREDFISPCYGLRVPSQTATFAAETSAGRTDFFTFLLPAGAAHENLSVKEITAHGGSGFVVDFGEFQDWLMTTGGEWVENELFGSDFRFAWARFERATLNLSELILIDGSRFVFNEAEILRLGKKSQYLCARRVDGSLSFENIEQGFDAMLSPNILKSET